MRGASKKVESLREVLGHPGKAGRVEFPHRAETGRDTLISELGESRHGLCGIGFDLSRAESLTVEKDRTERGESIRVTGVGRLVEPLPGLVVIDFLRASEFQIILGQLKHGLVVIFRSRLVEQLEREVRVFRLAGETTEVDRRHVAASRIEPAISGSFDVADAILGLFELLCGTGEDESVIVHGLELAELRSFLIEGHRLREGILLVALLDQETHGEKRVFVLPFVRKFADFVDRILKLDGGLFAFRHGGHGCLHRFDLSHHLGTRIGPLVRAQTQRRGGESRLETQCRHSDDEKKRFQDHGSGGRAPGGTLQLGGEKIPE